MLKKQSQPNWSKSGKSRHIPAIQLFDVELEIWCTRPVWVIPHLVLDARYEKVRHGGHIGDVALLIAVGVQSDGKRSLLGVSVALSYPPRSDPRYASSP